MKTQHVALEQGKVTRFTMQDAEAIKKIPSVKRTSPYVSGRVQIVYGNKNWNTQAHGAGVEYPLIRASIPTIGRFFTEEELRMRKKVIVLGATVIKELFGSMNPVGSIVKVNRIYFQVIGVLPPKGTFGWHDYDDMVIMPVTTCKDRVLGKEYLDAIDVEIKEADMVADATAGIEKVIIERHRLREDNKDSFQVLNMSEIQQTLSQTTKTMSFLLGVIAGISLLVGGIGIMNIMLVSVTERTREIGLRKAIGASQRDIMIQFLVEAVVMTFIGGLLGILCGASIAVVFSSIIGWTTKLSLFSVLLASSFSMGVGIIFGLWPARQASKLNPIEALRYE